MLLLHVCCFSAPQCQSHPWQLWLVNSSYPQRPQLHICCRCSATALMLHALIYLFHTGHHCNSEMRLGWMGAAEKFYSSATTPAASLCPFVTNFRTDWKTEERPTLTGRPPLVRMTPRDTTAVRWPLALWLCYETSPLWKRRITTYRWLVYSDAQRPLVEMIVCWSVSRLFW